MREFSIEAVNLLERLSCAGFRLHVDGEYIVVRGQLTDQLRSAIRLHKPELIELLKAGEGNWIRMAEWEFSMLRLPSQVDPAMNDCWLVGKEPATGRETTWFIGSKPKKGCAWDR